MTPRSWLFVPGDRPERMQKALHSGADALILDLEDSVSAGARPVARLRVGEFLQARAQSSPRLWVRINPLQGDGLDDLAGVLPYAPDGIVLPKTESGDHVRALEAELEPAEAALGLESGAIRILPITTETPRSLFGLESYAATHSRLAGLTWGAEDLSAAVGAMEARGEDGRLRPLYELARSLCLVGAAAAATPAIETVFPDFRDVDGLTRSAVSARRDGFVGMMAIHPIQIAAINRAFTPTEGEVERARRIVDLFAANPTSGALSMDGAMIDMPHLKQAQRILERARQADETR